MKVMGKKDMKVLYWIMKLRESLQGLIIKHQNFGAYTKPQESCV